MKISIGINLKLGPWGGGNQWGNLMASYLTAKGHTVVFDLGAKDIDVIVLVEPRSNLATSAFNHIDILDYLNYKNPSALVVHRINECDERKDTDGVNQILLEANGCADHTVFISTWLKELFGGVVKTGSNQSVILNGADELIFNSINYKKWDKQGPIRIVTHHWGAHWNKGFDVYTELDTLLDTPKYAGKVTFTFIGNLPDGVKFKNATHIAPQFGKELANYLQQHHIYLTASRNEPAGMHHVEGGSCGLPLLYIRSGGLPEYCEGYGVSFSNNDFQQKLDEILANYDCWVERIKEYSNLGQKMCNEYYKLFSSLIETRDQVLLDRGDKLEKINRNYLQYIFRCTRSLIRHVIYRARQ